MTDSTLRSYTYRDLAKMARSHGVVGWHSMRKDELVEALVMKHSKQPRRRRSRKTDSNGHSAADGRSEASTAKPSAGIRKQLSSRHAKREQCKILSSAEAGSSGGAEEDRLVVMVRDPYWLQAYWELTRRSIDRAHSAMGQFWHQSQPVLRLFRMATDGTAALTREIPIHGGVHHWYIDVHDPPSQFRMEIGYRTETGQFYCLARSNSVTTPPSGTSDAVDQNWTDVANNADRIFAMSGGYTPRGTSLELQELLEERLGRPMGTPMETRYGNGAARGGRDAENLRFSVDAELLVFGVSNPGVHVTLQGEPVPLRPDGSFSVRMSLAERRQVIPVVASSADGLEQRTIILAVERNTKVLEPRIRGVGQ